MLPLQEACSRRAVHDQPRWSTAAALPLDHDATGSAVAQLAPAWLAVRRPRTVELEIVMRVFAPARVSGSGGDHNCAVITRDADDDLWTVHISSVSEKIARETTDALNEKEARDG